VHHVGGLDGGKGIARHEQAGVVIEAVEDLDITAWDDGRILAWS